MNIRKIVISTGIVITLSGGYFQGAYAAATTGSADAVIVTPVTIGQSDAMNFGNIAAGASSSVIDLTTASVRSVDSGDAALVGGGTTLAGSFDITGASGTTVNLTLGSTATLGDGTNTMSAGTFVVDVANPITMTGSAVNVNVGAKLTVGASQASGSYSTGAANGSAYTATANYN